MNNIKTSRNNNAECPICHNKLENSVCTSCGWVHMVFPEQVPQAIAIFNAKRREVAMRILSQYETSTKKLNKLFKELEEAKEMASTYQNNANNTINEINKLKIELEEAKEMASTYQNNANNTINEINKLKIELEEAREKKANTHGIVYITDLANDFQAVATINSGINTYGSDATDGSHHMIRLSPFSIQLLAKHFSVEPIGKHLLLKDLTDGSMNIPKSGIYVEGKTIKINKDIEVKFLRIL